MTNNCDCSLRKNEICSSSKQHNFALVMSNVETTSEKINLWFLFANKRNIYENLTTCIHLILVVHFLITVFWLAHFLYPVSKFKWDSLLFGFFLSYLRERNDILTFTSKAAAVIYTNDLFPCVQGAVLTKLSINDDRWADGEESDYQSVHLDPANAIFARELLTRCLNRGKNKTTD